MLPLNGSMPTQTQRRPHVRSISWGDQRTTSEQLQSPVGTGIPDDLTQRIWASFGCPIRGCLGPTRGTGLGGGARCRAAGYQSFFNNSTTKGFVSVLVSATGEATNAIFAAVFEQGIAGPWLARHGMTSGLPRQAGTFQHLSVTAHDQKLVLRSCAI